MDASPEFLLGYCAFAAFFVAALGAISIWLQRTGHGGRIVAVAWALLVLGLVPGWFLTRASVNEERERRERAISGLAPTYAAELQAMGHHRIGLQTQPDDRLYLSMIERQKRWLVLNDQVADIYTFRKAAGGNQLIVDSETDYNHDNVIDRSEGSREERSAIGTLWDEESVYLDRAYAGETVFDGSPFEDFWGDWVSAYVPMYDPQGRVEAVLGVDFSAEEWGDGLRRARWLALGTLAVFLVSVLGLTTVIAVLRANLRERQRAAEHTRAIIDQAHDAFIAMDAGGLVTDWNPQSTRVFGWLREEALGKSVATLLLPERFRQRHEQAVQRYLRTGVSQVVGQRIDVIGRHRDGHEFPLEMTIAAIHEGTSCSFQAFLHDISERVEREAQLREAKDGAEAAARAKGEFIASVSHEIRTPLNGILGMGELLAATTLDERQLGYLKQVRKSSETLLHLLNDVLDMSKIEAGRVELESRVFDLRSSVAAILSSIRPEAERKGLRLEGAVEQDVPTFLRGDSARLGQVLANLLGNALKFTESGGVRLGVALHSGSSQAGLPHEGLSGEVMLLFSVSDTGIGIPPDKHESIFEAFKQEDASTTRRYGGTGLGLSICRHLVRRMGGEIRLTSHAGRGSTFTFSCRFLEATEAELSREQGPGDEDDFGVPVAPLEPLEILLAEDGKVNQQVAVGLLELDGHRVDVVEDGKQAVEAVCHGGYDLVLMDLQMPVMDGLDATRVIRDLERPAGRRTPIIALTAIAMKGDRNRCLRAGMDGYIAKPIHRGELRETMRRVLARGSSPTRPAAMPHVGPVPESTAPESTDPRSAAPKSGARSAATVVDWSVAARRIPGGARGIQELAAIMLTEGPRLVAEMRAGVADEDAERVRIGAHTLRGSAQHFGAEQLVTAAIDIESLARARDLEGVALLLPGIAAHVPRLSAELEVVDQESIAALLAGLGGGPSLDGS